ncbi:galactokinase family protein [Nocardiopsis halophila]|uniref:galactokinase family protein n=1 Tax=Nocardiopsis halophila TaxID=141692 RepID=UPI0003467EDC|nr:galactokinase family protein [Nocardiopsis halophila]
MKLFARLLGSRGRPGGPLHWPVAERVAGTALADAFADVYGTPPAGVRFAPGRVALMGDPGAQEDGPVLLAALPWGVHLAWAPTGDGAVELRHARAPQERRPLPAPLAARPAAEPGGGARVLFDTDLPAPASLGGREALAEALGAALGTGTALPFAERTVLRLDRRTGRARALPFDLEAAGLRLLVADTRSGPAADPARRRAECARAASRLGVSRLREVEDLAGALARLRDPVLRGRVRHAVTEENRLDAVAGLLRAGAPAEIGTVLTASHLSLRDHFAMSTPEQDLAVERAVGAGARGARATGGAGDAVVALVPAERAGTAAEAVRTALAERSPRVRTALP